MKRRLLRYIKIAALILLFIIGVSIAVILWSERDEAVIKEYVKNESLPTIKADW